MLIKIRGSELILVCFKHDVTRQKHAHCTLIIIVIIYIIVQLQNFIYMVISWLFEAKSLSDSLLGLLLTGPKGFFLSK